METDKLETFEKLNPVANYLFLEICCTGENGDLRNYLDGGLDLVESLIDGETAECSKTVFNFETTEKFQVSQ